MSLAILFHFLCAQHVSDINTGFAKKNVHTLTDGICVLFSKLNYHYNM